MAGEGAGTLTTPELRGEGYRAAHATGTAHRKQDLLLLLLVEIGAIDELPGLLLEQRMEREGAIRNLILGSDGRRSGLGEALFRRPAAAAVLLAPCHRSLRSLAFGRRADAARDSSRLRRACRYRVQDRQAFSAHRAS